MMSFLKSAFGGLSASVSKEFGKFNDRQTMEAITSIMVATAYADGELEAAESAKLDKVLSKHPIMAQFDSGEVAKKVRELRDAFEDIGKEYGQNACLKESKDIANAPYEKRKMVMLMGVTMARADGELEDSEREVLVKHARVLDVGLGEIGL